MTVLQMLYVLTAQAKGKGSLLWTRMEGGGWRVGGQPQASVQTPTVSPICTQKTPGACTQSASSPLRSRVQGKNPQQPQGPRQVGVGTRRNVLLAAPSHGPSPPGRNISITSWLGINDAGRQPSEPAWQKP